MEKINCKGTKMPTQAMQLEVTKHHGMKMRKHMKGQKLKPSISKSSDGPSSYWTPVSFHWRTGPISAMKILRLF